MRTTTFVAVAVWISGVAGQAQAQGWPTGGVRVRVSSRGGDRVAGRLTTEPSDTVELVPDDPGPARRWAVADLRNLEIYDGYGPDLGKGFVRGALVGIGLAVGIVGFRGAVEDLSNAGTLALAATQLGVGGALVGMLAASRTSAERWRSVPRQWWPIAQITRAAGLTVGVRFAVK